MFDSGAWSWFPLCVLVGVCRSMGGGAPGRVPVWLGRDGRTEGWRPDGEGGCQAAASEKDGGGLHDRGRGLWVETNVATCAWVKNDCGGREGKGVEEVGSGSGLPMVISHVGRF